jgi:general secretion pathway protein G
MKQRGFTLIELLVVFTIIGILATLAASSFRMAQIRARDSARKSDLTQVRTALELYKGDEGLYLVGNSYANLKSSLEGGTYMKEVPTDPKTGNNYYYSSADGSDYTLRACLENPKEPKAEVPPQSPCPVASYTLTAP